MMRRSEENAISTDYRTALFGVLQVLAQNNEWLANCCKARVRKSDTPVWEPIRVKANGRTKQMAKSRMAEPLLIRCPVCGATNRLPGEKLVLGARPRCGRCKTPLPVDKPITVSDGTFSAEVENFALPVLVDAWAAWCGPCRMIAPVIDELASELVGKVRVAKLDVDANPQTAARFDLRSIPTLLVIKAGREVDRIVGVQPKAEIVRRLERAIR
jgi:thioredoxin 2